MLIALIISCLLLDVTREIFFKMGARAIPSFDNFGVGLFARAVQNRWTLVGITIWAIEILLWAQVLARLPLSVAVPIMSMTYALTPLAGAVVFSEKISLKRWLAIALVTAGAAMVGAAGGIA